MIIVTGCLEFSYISKWLYVELISRSYSQSQIQPYCLFGQVTTPKENALLNMN
jgi:hypothetical protein